MAKLTVYRQLRYDGGIRRGIELDDQTLAETFEEGSGDHDPALLWFVDLRCEGPGVPDDPDQAESWLIEQSAAIRDAFARYAEKLRIGADRGDYVLRWAEFPGAPQGVEMEIVGSAVRRIDALGFASILDEMAEHWDDQIRAMLSAGQTT